MELKPELAQRLNKKKGKRQAVSLVNSQLQLQSAQAVQNVQPLQLVQPTQLMQSTQYVRHDVGVPYGWRAPAVGAVQRQWEGNQAQGQLPAWDRLFYYLGQGLLIGSQGAMFEPGHNKGGPRVDPPVPGDNYQDCYAEPRRRQGPEERPYDGGLYGGERQGSSDVYGSLRERGYTPVFGREEWREPREALLDRSLVGVRRLGDVLGHDGHRRVSAHRQGAVLDCVDHQREDDRH
ncbi:hypothetical protein PC110_g15076 [Phytophthora cactorum]|uniref:Uncharacterized protein n=1 Tax=Phytophthora cactorum TaxID=29920 RepID=A0A329RVK5_9STRA|nr:hypothetical protein PC110_g15076 [Phytophthora cactorum]